jgi:hypothetical protein
LVDLPKGNLSGYSFLDDSTVDFLSNKIKVINQAWIHFETMKCFVQEGV